MTQLQTREFAGFLSARLDRIARWCVGGIDPKSLHRIAVRAYADPKGELRECTPESIALALTHAAQVGLDPSGIGGEGYLVRYGKTAQFMPGWQGLAKLARQSGMILDIWAYTVRKGDDFLVRLGTDPSIHHEPSMSGGDIVAAYAVAEKREGRPHFEVLTADDIDRIRSSSKSRNGGPWKQWPEEMARKSAVRRLCKHLPRTRELDIAIEIDNAIESGADVGEIIDIGSVDLDDAETVDADENTGGGVDAVKKALAERGR